MHCWDSAANEQPPPVRRDPCTPLLADEYHKVDFGFLACSPAVDRHGDPRFFRYPDSGLPQYLRCAPPSPDRIGLNLGLESWHCEFPSHEIVTSVSLDFRRPESYPNLDLVSVTLDGLSVELVPGRFQGLITKVGSVPTLGKPRPDGQYKVTRLPKVETSTSALTLSSPSLTR